MRTTQNEFRESEKNCSKANKLAGEKVTLMYDKVKINGKVYIWDDVKNDKTLMADVAQASSP